MKIAVIGAGALGCMVGARLSLKNPVTMLCRRQEQIDDILGFGLTVYEKDGKCSNYKNNVSACLSGNCQDTVDLVIVLTKTSDTRAALKQNQRLLTSSTKVLCLQNGGGNDDILAEFCPRENIFIGTTKHNCVNLGNGSVRHSGDGATYVGASTPGPSAAFIVKLLQEAGLDAEEVPNIQRLIWEKLFVNLSINSFTAIVRAPIGACVDSSNSWFFMERLICEAVDVANACGLDFSYLEVLNMVHATCHRVSTGYSSMSQDVMNARLTEVDSINGYVVNQAKRYNLPTPYNEFVQHLVHAVEDTYKSSEMPVVRYEANQVIIQEGQTNSTIFSIVKGAVALYFNYGKENERMIGVLKDDQVFGEISSYTGAIVRVTAVTCEESLIMIVPKESRERFISLHPRSVAQIIKYIAKNTQLYQMHAEIAIAELDVLKSNV